MSPAGSLTGDTEIETALRRVGELLEAQGFELVLLIAGGAALNLLRIVERTTQDVDVLAFVRPKQGAPQSFEFESPPEPLPIPLQEAVQTVAADMNLQKSWLDTKIAAQLRSGLPENYEKRIVWRKFSKTFTVGILSREDLIALKLYAAADDANTSSVHYQDLVALRPSRSEILTASDWVREQDPSVGFHSSLESLLAILGKDVIR